jgi:formylglycine-generating enzyme
MRTRAETIVALAVALGCDARTAKVLPPTGQVLLYVTTDAPLPTAARTNPDAEAQPGLFDRLRLEVFPPGATEPCDGCSRDFELDGETVSNDRASFGVVAQPGASGYAVRARIFRGISLSGDQPPPFSTIDSYVSLPVVAAEGIVVANVVLRVEDIGHTLGTLEKPIASGAGKPDFSRIGVWAGARRLPCAGVAQAGESCVPGGAFWLGHPYGGLNEDGTDASISRLAVVSPFFVDRHEVTVADFRASSMAVLEKGSSVDPQIGPPDPVPADYPYTPSFNFWPYFCDYSDQPIIGNHSREENALNCISWMTADAYCRARGKRLPSEAEYEYMAGGLKSNLFLWGSDRARCGDAVWGRQYMGENNCLPPNELGGPLPPGHGNLDKLMLAEGAVLDLAGNVSEWTRDSWNRPDEPCWAGKSLVVDPECATPSTDGDFRTIKEGGWVTDIPPASFRIGRPPDRDRGRPQTGFRCVRPAKAR